jgi:hypothetical protein
MLVGSTGAIKTYGFLGQRSRIMATAGLAIVKSAADLSTATYQWGGLKLSEDQDAIGLLRALHAWVFADPFYRSFGQPMAAFYRLQAPTNCSGGVLHMAGIAGDVQRGTRVYGWGTIGPATHPAAVDRVLLVSPEGVVIGLARNLKYGENFARLPENIPFGDGWYGFVRPLPRSVPLVPYAVSSDGSSACPLSGAATMPADVNTTQGLGSH